MSPPSRAADPAPVGSWLAEQDAVRRHRLHRTAGTINIVVGFAFIALPILIGSHVIPLYIFGGLQLACGVGFTLEQRWPRGPLRVLSALCLPAIPIGTLSGGYTIWALHHTEPEDAPAPAPAPADRRAHELRLLTRELRAKGFQNPVATVCDGVDCVVSHAQGVTLPLSWIREADNPFHVPVLDCREICSRTLVFPVGDQVAAVNATLDGTRTAGEADLRARLTGTPVTTETALGYPRLRMNLPEGPLVAPVQTEDLWTIYRFGRHLYFTRSWTGQVRYRAQVSVLDRGMFIEAVETFGSGAAEDVRFSLRQVDYLVKAALCGLVTPAPVPARLTGDPRAAVRFALTEYGRLAGFVSPADTVPHRLGLNGLPVTAPPNPDNPAIVSALRSLRADEGPSQRARLLETLRDREVAVAVLVPGPENAPDGGSDDGEVTVTVCQGVWNGDACFFAYSDPSYCVESAPPYTLRFLRLRGSELAGRLRQSNPDAVLVLNPGGPVTAVLRLPELEAIASGGRPA